MAKRATSPTLQLTIGEKEYEHAIASSSGGCLIADAIKSQYPQYTGVSVDMATIRFSDPEKGVRYTYLTSPDAEQYLLFFDQGWRHPEGTLVVKRAVKITTIVAGKSTAVRDAERAARIDELEAKLAAGDVLTGAEKASLTRMTNPKPRPNRPVGFGPAEVQDDGTIVGGRPSTKGGKRNPNLLAGRNRHYGAKMAKPGVAFEQAVEAAVKAGGLTKYDQPSV